MRSAWLVVALLCAACGSRTDQPLREQPAPRAPAVATQPPVARSPTTRAPATTPPATTPPATTPPATTPPVVRAAPTASPVVEVRYRLVRRTTDAATADFAAVVEQVLADPRGWQRAGFRLVRDDSAAYAVVIGEPDDVQQLCLPLDVDRTYSCQNGPVVALNAARWRSATPKWTGSLAGYKQMLVNHEVGHLLGQRHPSSPQCPMPGVPARVMAQQSTELEGCLPNPWPLPGEVTRAARHDLPLAPPPD